MNGTPTGDSNPIRRLIGAWARVRGGIRRLLATGMLDIERRGVLGRTPLFGAADEGDGELAERLLEHGANPNARGDRGDRPLHWAADGDMVRLLVAAGADLESKDMHCGTPLQWAAQRNRLDAMRALLAAGASVSGSRQITATPLHSATSRAVVELLLRHGAELDVQDGCGRSPLWHAVWLIDEEERRETAYALLERGADPLLRDEDGASPWHLSRTRGDAEVRRRLTSAVEAAGRSFAPRVTVEDAFAAPQDLLAVAGGVAVTTTGHPAVVRWRLDDTPRIARVEPGSYERIDDVALGPDRSIALAYSDRLPEIRPWDSSQSVRKVRLEDAEAAQSIDVSPDGRWIAAGVPEEVQLARFADGRVVCCAEGGQGTVGVRFSPDGRYLATACASQGGAGVRLDAVTGGKLVAVAGVSRSDVGTGAEDFVDRLGGLAFSPDAGCLLFWETAMCSWESKPRGWRGNLVCFDVAGRRLRWVTRVDESVTGDARSLADVGQDLGYLAPFALDPHGRRVAVGVGRQLLVLDAGTGALRKAVKLDHEILAMGLDADRGRWLLATGGGGLTWRPASYGAIDQA